MVAVKKKYIPYIIGLPNMGVGILWAMNLVLIPMLGNRVTESNSKLALMISMGAFTGIFVQYLAGVLSDRSHFKMGRRKPYIIGGSLSATVFMCLMPFAGDYNLLFVISFLFYFSLNFYQGIFYLFKLWLHYSLLCEILCQSIEFKRGHCQYGTIAFNIGRSPICIPDWCAIR